MSHVDVHNIQYLFLFPRGFFYVIKELIKLNIICTQFVLDFRGIQPGGQEGTPIWTRNIRDCDKWYNYIYLNESSSTKQYINPHCMHIISNFNAQLISYCLKQEIMTIY